MKTFNHSVIAAQAAIHSFMDSCLPAGKAGFCRNDPNAIITFMQKLEKKGGEGLMEVKSKQVNILLVDDEDLVLNTLGKMIESLGWKCFRAPTGEIALDAFKLNEVHAVILDLNLPAMHGFEVLKQMKTLKPNVPVVILTGLGYDKERVDEAVLLGAAGYVGKAMPVRSVISKIKTVLGQ